MAQNSLSDCYSPASAFSLGDENESDLKCKYAYIYATCM